MTQFRIYHSAERDEYDLFGRTDSNAGSTYKLWSPIPVGFPDARPPVYVLEPNPLRTARGGTVSALGLSHEMHTLQPGPRSMVQICHWRAARWHAAITLDKVMLKALIWIEAYEQHLETGHPIKDFVTTMPEA